MSEQVCPKCGLEVRELPVEKVRGQITVIGGHTIDGSACLTRQLAQRDAAIKVKDAALEAAEKKIETLRAAFRAYWTGDCLCWSGCQCGYGKISSVIYAFAKGRDGNIFSDGTVDALLQQL